MSIQNLRSIFYLKLSFFLSSIFVLVYDRCVRAEECRNFNINLFSEFAVVPFQRVCQEGCPKNFDLKFAVEGNRMSAACFPCTGRGCLRKCPGHLIDSAESAVSIKDCQVVEGNLEFKLIGTMKPAKIFQKILCQV